MQGDLRDLQESVWNLEKREKVKTQLGESIQVKSYFNDLKKCWL